MRLSVPRSCPLCAPFDSLRVRCLGGFHERNRIRFLSRAALCRNCTSFAGGSEEHWTFGVGISRKCGVAKTLQSCRFHPPAKRGGVESLREVPHRLTQVLPVVRHHVEYQQSST